MNQEFYDELEKILKSQRHEFINHIQVVHAMLQLGRVEKALQYLESLAKDPSLLEEPLRLYRQKSAR